MILHIGNISFWFGTIPTKRNSFIPYFSYLNGGCYWKFSLLWFKILLELSGPKEDNREYKEVTKEELDKILLELDDYAN